MAKCPILPDLPRSLFLPPWSGEVVHKAKAYDLHVPSVWIPTVADCPEEFVRVAYCHK